MRSALFSFFGATISLALVLTLTQVGSAQVRTSPNYQLQSDSINVGGGFSSSTNYQQESTVGEIATGVGTSSNYQLRAGYQQMQEVFLSMTAAADVVMDASLPGITGGTSNGSTTVTVTTDSPAGYTLSLEAASSPAMQSGANSIPDHATAPAGLGFQLGASEARFGYSPTGSDLSQRFLNNGSFCNLGSTNTSLACWSGLTTSAVIISQSINDNHPAGADTTVNFRVDIANGAAVMSGLYIATTTLTALPL